MPKLLAVALALSLLLCPPPARAEPVYEFVAHCRKDRLGDCFALIGERLGQLDSAGKRRVCLPRRFGGTLLENGVLPVSLLEYVRINLSAARFGHAEADADDVMARVINDIYPCSSDRAGLR